MTTRERILQLLDEGTFVETDAHVVSRAQELAADKVAGDGAKMCIRDRFCISTEWNRRKAMSTIQTVWIIFLETDMPTVLSRWKRITFL